MNKYRMRKTKSYYRTDCGYALKSSGLDKLVFKSNGVIKIIRIGDILHPNCGHKPNDFVVEDIVLSGRNKETYSFWGYHPASEKKRRFIRGFIYKDNCIFS